jgi:hypothetical protein
LQKLALITSVLYPWALQSLEIFVTDITPGYSAGAYGAFPVRLRCQSRMRPSKGEMSVTFASAPATAGWNPKSRVRLSGARLVNATKTGRSDRLRQRRCQ